MAYLEVHSSENQGEGIPEDLTGPNERNGAVMFRLNHCTIKF